MSQILTINIDEIEAKQTKINVYPNPFRYAAMVYVQGYEGGNLLTLRFTMR